MKRKIYETLKLILCLLFFLFIGEILRFAFGIFGIDVNSFSNKNFVVYQLVVSLFMFIILFKLYYKTIKEDYNRFKKNIIKNALKILKLFIFFMFIKYIVSIVSVLIMMAFNLDTSSLTSVNQELIETYLKTSPILMFISTVLLAPFYEEILFRLGFKKLLKNKYIYIILSGTIFGLLHIFPLEEGISLALGITQSISYVTMGIILSYIYFKNDNIFMSIGVHFLNNLLSIIAMLSMF